MLSWRSSETSGLPASALASRCPPSALTRDDTIMKSSIFGVVSIRDAMAKAPSSSLMLLYKWSFLSVCLQARRLLMALQAATEHPMLRKAMLSRVFWVVKAVEQATIPFSPSALSLRSRALRLSPATESHRHLSDFMASASGLPAITSLRSRSSKVSRHAAKASAATSAASTPKLFVLSLIFLTVCAEGSWTPKIGAKSSLAVSAVTNSLFPSQRSRNSVTPPAPAPASFAAEVPPPFSMDSTASTTSLPAFRA
mmetsp:Transcript_10941/g.22768  ORF Transcript_10941/g.22768 Transcript_10941/m.22768 type:complete len:254 (-) Transcript_10941:320-1081(-)